MVRLCSYKGVLTPLVVYPVTPLGTYLLDSEQSEGFILIPYNNVGDLFLKFQNSQ